MSASTSVLMIAPSPVPTAVQTRNGNSYTANAYGVVTVQAIDVPDLIAAGFSVLDLGTPPTSKAMLLDDFLGAAMLGLWTSHKGSDGGCADWAVAAAANGAIAGTAGAGAGATMAVNGVQVDAALNWKGAQGGLSIEAAVKIDVLTTVALFVGFTDQVAALEMPFTLSGGTLTSNATDAVGFLFDTAATAATWKMVGVKQDVDATLQDTGIAPVAATLETFRIDVDTDGNALFYRNGTQIGVEMENAVRPSIALSPVIAGFSRAASARIFTCDFIKVSQNR